MKPVTKGILWILGPWISLILILAIWAVASFTFGSMVTTGPSGGVVAAARTLNVILGFVGIISVVMIPVGLIVGIVLIAIGAKNEQPPPPGPQM